jgi:hypothetical protein
VRVKASVRTALDSLVVRRAAWVSMRWVQLRDVSIRMVSGGVDGECVEVGGEDLPTPRREPTYRHGGGPHADVIHREEVPGRSSAPGALTACAGPSAIGVDLGF